MSNSIDAKSTTKLLPQLAAFVAVVEAGSFTRAARQTGIDKTLLSRRVLALERGLGVGLLQRTTRKLRTTRAGQLLYERAASPLGDALSALVQASAPEQIEGTVRVATLAAFTDDLWAPVALALRRRYSGLHLDLRAGDTFIDLVDSGIDLAIRSGHMPDSSFTGKRLCAWRYVLCAAPQWLEAHGSRIRHPGDLSRHWLFYTGVERADHWRFERGDVQADVVMHDNLKSDSGAVVESMVRAGFGVAAFPPFAVRASIEANKLARVLPQWRVAHAHTIWAVMSNRDFVPARVQVVIDAVKAQAARVEQEWSALSD